MLAVIGVLAAPDLFDGGAGSKNAVQDKERQNNAQAGGSEERSGGEQGSGGNQQGATSSQAPAGGTADNPGQGEFTTRAAEQTVEEFYTKTSEGDYDTSAQLLSESWRQRWFPDRATFEKVESVVFIAGPNAEISGNAATVTGETQATLTGEIQHNEGTWYLVQEGGRWK